MSAVKRWLAKLTGGTVARHSGKAGRYYRELMSAGRPAPKWPEAKEEKRKLTFDEINAAVIEYQMASKQKA